MIHASKYLLQNNQIVTTDLDLWCRFVMSVNWMKRVTIQTVNTAVQPIIIIFGKMVPNLVVTIWCSGFPLLFPIPSRQTDHIWIFMWKKSPFWPNLKLSGGLKNWQERGGSQKSNLGGTLTGLTKLPQFTRKYYWLTHWTLIEWRCPNDIW